MNKLRRGYMAYGGLIFRRERGIVITIQTKALEETRR